MRNASELEGSARRYATAHAAHYGAGDLNEAIGLYMAIITDHPDANEAGYSRSQLANIVKTVVPQQELLETGVRLALGHLRRGPVRKP